MTEMTRDALQLELQDEYGGDLVVTHMIIVYAGVTSEGEHVTGIATLEGQPYYIDRGLIEVAYETMTLAACEDF